MRRAVTVLALVAVALSGCASIPTSSGVNEGDIVEEDFDPTIVQRSDPPLPGATPEQILTGFMQAAVDPSGNYEIARLFLDESVRDEWSPSELVLIRQGMSSIDEIDESTLTYEFTSSAYVDENGLYREDPLTPIELEFDFVQNEQGEWRIADVPAGLVLPESNFTLGFRPIPLWFFDPTFEYLVPDVRWFATRRPALASTVVAELLEGPSPYLGQGAVVGSFPAGTSRGAAPVEISAGEAVVDLSGAAAESTALERDRMRQQLVETLRGGWQVSNLVVTVDGLPLPISSDAGPDAVTQPAVESAPLVLRDGVLGFATRDELSPIPGVSEAVAPLGIQAIDYSTSASIAAALTGSGVYAVTRDGAELVDPRADLVAPSVDSSGFVWTATGSGAADIRATEADGTPHDVQSELSSDVEVAAMSVSRDGARLVLYLDTPTASRLVVAGIVREEGVPVALTTEVLELPAPTTDPIDVAWVSESTIVALSEGDGGASDVTLYQLGGPRSTLGSIPGAVSISGGNGGTAGIRVLADGELWQRRGSVWQSTGIDADVLASQH